MHTTFEYPTVENVRAALGAFHGQTPLRLLVSGQRYALTGLSLSEDGTELCLSTDQPLYAPGESAKDEIASTKITYLETMLDMMCRSTDGASFWTRESYQSWVEPIRAWWEAYRATQKTSLREQALAKLTSEEREALGI